MARVAMALGGLAASDAGRCLYDLRRKTCTKQSLASLGMAQSDIRHDAELASAGSYLNTRIASADDVESILIEAFNGLQALCSEQLGPLTDNLRSEVSHVGDDGHGTVRCWRNVC